MRIVYTISPCICMFMYPSFLSCFLCVRTFYSISPYFVVCLCIQAFYPVSYVSGLFTLFHHTLLYVYVSKLFILFLMCQNFLLYFTIHMCYVSMFLFYFTIYINHICYVSKLLTLFHHINFTCLCIHIYMFSHMNTNSLKIVSIIL